MGDAAALPNEVDEPQHVAKKPRVWHFIENICYIMLISNFIGYRKVLNAHGLSHTPLDLLTSQMKSWQNAISNAVNATPQHGGSQNTP
jgi:hypothetical protein